jgi:CHAT domain-containing protein
MLGRALQLVEGVRGPDDLYVTELVGDLAGNALEARDNARAETLYQRALAVLQHTLGAEHPHTAIVQSRLALLSERDGQRVKAEPQLRQACAVIEKTLGPDHPWFLRCLITMANFRDDAGDLEQAETIDRRAMAIVERSGDTETISYSDLLNNLGDIYRRKQNFAAAEDMLRRSLLLGERLRGPDSYYVGTALQNLGIVARERRDYATAEACYLRALAIRERVVGPDHTDIAQLLNNLANIYHALGDDDTALAMYFRSLDIWEKAGGPYQRGTLLSVGNIAKTYVVTGDLAKAVAFQRRADAILELQMGLNLSVGSERQKLAFVSSVAERTDRTISLHLSEAPANADASALAAQVLLQRKGRVLDAMTDTFAPGRQRVADATDRALVDQLDAATTQLARLALGAPGSELPEVRQRSIKQLQERKEQLEGELSEHSSESRAEMLPVTLPAVQAAMPADAALVEFAVFRPFDPRIERNADAYGAPHYAAYVVRKDAVPVGRDLGAVKTIDAAIDALREALRDPARADVVQRARAVEEQVMAPLHASLGEATRLLLSPDGNLNLVPFEALVDGEDRYLIERYAISYLTSGRDLLRLQVPRMSRSNPLIVADPLFGEAAAVTNGEAARKRPEPQLTRGNGTVGDELSAIYFAPIAATASEARAIKTFFPEATLLTGALASKATLQRVDAPRMLHIASHGFFLQDAGSDRRQAGAAIDVENPLLRSGLALAGANRTHNAHGNDGILTALEAARLNLWGTKLVTLSACDTGVGEVRNGEGVYGLRRAIFLAGAETLVMSLWPVSDYLTRETMAAYYAGLRDGVGRGDALRQAKLAMLKRPDRQHPFYWASFIQSGEWANLDGRR